MTRDFEVSGFLYNFVGMKIPMAKLDDYSKRGLLFKQTHKTLPLSIWNYTPEVQYGQLWDDITLSCRGLVTDPKGNVVA